MESRSRSPSEAAAQMPEAGPEPENADHPEEPQHGPGPDQGLDVERKGRRPALARRGGQAWGEPAEGQDARRDAQPKEGDGVPRGGAAEPSPSRARRAGQEEPERAEDPEAQAAGMELRPGEDARERRLVGGAAGAPRGRSERLRDLERRAPGRVATAPEASPRGPREREGPRVEAVRDHEDDARAER